MGGKECTRAGCPYHHPGISPKGKRVGLCGMPRPFLEAGCPDPIQPERAADLSSMYERRSTPLMRH